MSSFVIVNQKGAMVRFVLKCGAEAYPVFDNHKEAIKFLHSNSYPDDAWDKIVEVEVKRFPREG